MILNTAPASNLLHDINGKLASPSLRATEAYAVSPTSVHAVHERSFLLRPRRKELEHKGPWSNSMRCAKQRGHCPATLKQLHCSLMEVENLSKLRSTSSHPALKSRR